GIDDDVGTEPQRVVIEKRREARRRERIEQDEKSPRPIEIATEGRQLLREEVLLRARDDERGGADRHLATHERDGDDLVVLLLEHALRGAVAVATLRAREIALAVAEHPADRLPLLPRHLENAGDEHFFAGARDDAAAAARFDDERAI